MKKRIADLIRPHILKMKPYSSARSEYTGHDGIFLDANENSIGSVCGTLHNRYPDPLQEKVKIKLATLEKINANQIFIGNGSDECIDVLIRAFCEPKEDSILICPPVFSMYEHAAHAQNIDIKEILLLDNFQLNVAEILKEIEVNTSLKIIFICTPNNPTGNTIQAKDIEKILAQFSGIVLIDEAYQDFSEEESWTQLLNKFPNLAVIKTFSKAFGMADARVGMLFASEEIIHYMNVIKLPYNVNQYSQLLTLEALENIDKKQAFIRTLNEGRSYFLSALQEIDFVEKVYPSDANFILFKVADANALYQYLIAHKIIVRNRNTAPLLQGCLRVSIGTKTENERFIEVLKNYV
ncbi:MAG: histidinol-phosphate transaminase [Chitinophagales bacterium]|nr:histidinol-phosphate transaminase [Bacteroidota bacterium]